MSQIARDQAGLPANLLRKFIAVGAGDSEVAAWMAARVRRRASRISSAGVAALAEATATVAEIRRLAASGSIRQGNAKPAGDAICRTVAFEFVSPHHGGHRKHGGLPTVKTTSPVIGVFVLEHLLGVNFLSFMQTQGDGHRLA